MYIAGGVSCGEGIKGKCGKRGRGCVFPRIVQELFKTMMIMMMMMMMMMEEVALDSCRYLRGELTEQVRCFGRVIEMVGTVTVLGIWL